MMKFPAYTTAVILVLLFLPLVLPADEANFMSLAQYASANKPEFIEEKAEPQRVPSLRFGEWAGDPEEFFKGAFAAFLGHESGHLIANFAQGTDLYLKSVNYGPIPFFTIQPGRKLTRKEHYITASAGFNAQHIINEWILTKHPSLKNEDEPFLKGMAAFNFWLTVGYAASALTRTGPLERDTKGMADSLGWNERWVGAMILVPTAFDTYRYKHPDAKWAKTASRLSKLLIIGLAIKAGD